MGDRWGLSGTVGNVIVRAVAVTAGLGLVTACSTPTQPPPPTTADRPTSAPVPWGTPGPKTATSSRAPAPATTEAAASATYAERVQTVVLDGLMDNDYQRPATFRDMCTTIVVWACAIAKIESDASGTVQITLAPEDVWIAKWDGSTDWYDFGEHVARGVYNFTLDQVQPPLRQIDVLTSEGDIAYLGNY